MLDLEDIKKLTEYQKEIFSTKEDIRAMQESMNENFSLLTNSIDSFAKEALKNSQEIAVWGNKITRLETHIKILADKAGVKLEY